MTTLKAHWIWREQKDLTPYNQSVIAAKSFSLPKVAKASIAITADCWYRLHINGHWINDGPCRSWPEHHQYDQLDVAWALQPGRNEITVTARHWHVGGFLQCPVQVGLLVQLDATLPDGRQRTITSDGTWQIAAAPQWIENTPKDGIQMGPAELCDARLARKPKFAPAKVLCGAHEGPWQDLRPAQMVPTTRNPVSLERFVQARVVRVEGMSFCFPRIALAHPSLVEANTTMLAPFALATVIKLSKPSRVQICAQGPRGANPRVLVDGRFRKQGKHQLTAGTHLLLMFNDDVICHDKDFNVRLTSSQKLRLENPLRPGYENPWCLVDIPEFAYANNDMRWVCFSDDDRELQEACNGYRRFIAGVEKKVTDKRSFLKVLGPRSRCLPSKKMLLHDSYPDFVERTVIGDAADLVTNPAALMHANSDSTVVHPSPKGDIELLYDLGRQDCGYFEIDMLADAGVTVDMHAVENIEGDRIQHTHYNRNAMRYVTKQGSNRYISLKRRAGRFLFVTIRDAQMSVTIRRIGLISSTYPVEKIGAFSCSDSRLADVWQACARTLQLCMEDTFTDCPLYEQTLWVGDARNEALFAYPVFGATDIAQRSLELAAQSLERLPMVGCQVPSNWDVIIPAWSFLWGVGVWDYYWYAGDKKFLAKIWPAVMKNLQQAEKYVNRRGLFSQPFWNMFDWAKIDDEQECVLHNSLFMVGAIDAARKCAQVLQKKTQDKWLLNLRQRLVKGINGCWDDERKAYPDSIHKDETVSNSICQHTSFLALLYDVIPASKRKSALQNVLSPPSNMVKVGSPFAMLYLYEALEKYGQEDEIVASIYKNYLPMLKAGATTVWECFPGGTAVSGSGNFPTRSHCHGWSAAAAYCLNRIVLGVKQTDIAGKAFEISPRLSGLDWARGRIATIQGPISISWEIQGKTLVVNYTLPPGVSAQFVRNGSHKGLRTRIGIR